MTSIEPIRLGQWKIAILLQSMELKRVYILWVLAKRKNPLDIWLMVFQLNTAKIHLRFHTLCIMCPRKKRIIRSMLMLHMDQLIYSYLNMKMPKILMIKLRHWHRVYQSLREILFGLLRILIKELVLGRERFSSLTKIEITALNAIYL